MKKLKMDLIQREDHNKKPLTCFGYSRYPDIPKRDEYRHNYGWEVPNTIHGWQWSSTFGRWSALVTFNDGWYGFSFPKFSAKQNEEN